MAAKTGARRPEPPGRPAKTKGPSAKEQDPTKRERARPGVAKREARRFKRGPKDAPKPPHPQQKHPTCMGSGGAARCLGGGAATFAPTPPPTPPEPLTATRGLTKPEAKRAAPRAPRVIPNAFATTPRVQLSRPQFFTITICFRRRRRGNIAQRKPPKPTLRFSPPTNPPKLNLRLAIKKLRTTSWMEMILRQTQKAEQTEYKE